jgi:hypothetical protein
LQTVLITGGGCGVVGVVWGDWRGGACVHADAEGLVWATDGGPGDGLRGVRLYGLSAAEVPDLLALLDSVERGTPLPPPTASTSRPLNVVTTPPPPAATAPAGSNASAVPATGDAIPPTRPTPPTDRPTPGDLDNARTAVTSDRGDFGESRREDSVTARIARALESV